MNKQTHITLVRHGETIWNRELRMQGSMDIPLSDVGLAQAEQVAKRLKKAEPHHRVYTSHLQRAHKTGSVIADALQVPHHVEQDLQERRYGVMEGLTREEILSRHPGFWEPGFDESKVEGVETVETLRDRVYNAVQAIADRHPGERLVLVSHGGTINALLHRLSGGAHGTGISRLGNTSVSEVVRDANGAWRIESVGCTKHLEEQE